MRCFNFQLKRHGRSRSAKKKYKFYQECSFHVYGALSDDNVDVGCTFQSHNFFIADDFDVRCGIDNSIFRDDNFDMRRGVDNRIVFVDDNFDVRCGVDDRSFSVNDKFDMKL